VMISTILESGCENHLALSALWSRWNGLIQGWRASLRLRRLPLAVTCRAYGAGWTQHYVQSDTHRN